MSPSFTTGARLGRYQIRSKIGEGGMGEVYLAVDTSELGRTVAIKVLPADVASDPTRMQRFVQEAKIVSALNHPNILTIHEFGQEGATRFITTEHVDGVTLREYLTPSESRPARRLKLHVVLDIAIQVAAALDAAHEAQVVHRDIKPENIMVRRRDAIIKVLDFGLAKPTEKSISGQTNAGARTTVMVNTEPGVVMGTISYMSPEQSMGSAQVDHRTDIWSLGVVLYEMVAGCLPFDGKDAHRQIIAIQETDAPPLSRYAEGVPDRLEDIIAKALAKDSNERYQTAKDLLIDLRTLRRRLDLDAEIDRSAPPELRDSKPPRDSGGRVTTMLRPGTNKTISESPVRASQLEQASPISSSKIILKELRRHRTGLILVLVAMLVTITAAWSLWHRLGGAKPSRSAKQMTIARLVTGAGDINSASISPDGKYVSYALYKDGRVSLRVKQVSSGSDREIVAPIDDAEVNATVFSPDSELVYYRLFQSQRNPLGTLYEVPVIGGREPKKILDHITGIISFAPDGKRFAFIRRYPKTDIRGLMVASLDGGEQRELAAPGNPDWFEGIPAWSPDGKVIVCAGGTITGGLHSRLLEVPAEGGVPRTITAHQWRGQIYRPTWLRDGSGLILNAKELPSSPMQIVHVSYPEGVVTKITNDLTEYGVSSFGLTADSSTIVTTVEDTSTKIWFASADAERGRARKLTNGKYDGKSGLDITPDGRVVYVATTGDRVDIWIMNADGTGQKQLTSNDEIEHGVSVSADGRYIVFDARGPAGVGQIWRMDTDGGNVKQLTHGGSGDYGPFCSPDGRWVVFGSYRWNKFRLSKVPIDGGEVVKINDLAFNGRMFSPNGKLISGNYFDEQVNPPKWRGALVPFDGGPPLKVFDYPPRSTVHSMADERTLLYVLEDGEVENIWTRAIDSGAPKQLTSFTSEYIYDYALSRDGKKFALVRGTSTTDIILIKDFR